MNNYKESIIKINATILDAINAINRSKAKIALVLDSSDKLCGTITDGDIRRSILNNQDLNCLASKIMNTDYLSINADYDHKKAKHLMIKKGVNFVPMIDNKKKLLDLLCLNDFNSKNIFSNPIVIMAGGKGTRLKPYTDSCPKPMLEIQGKPMLEHILENCISSGFENFYFSVNYLKENIINYFGDGSDWNVKINYLIEEQELGTAGSLFLLKDIGKSPIFVINGDILTKIDIKNLNEFHLKNKLDATIAVREETFKIPFGVIESKDIKLISIKEKPLEKKLVNAGVYCFDPIILKLLDPNKYWDMPDFLNHLAKLNYSVGVFPIHEYWIDIGRPETLIKAKKEWN